MGKTTFILLMAFPFLCVNMPDKRPLSVLNRLKNARRNIETVIGQLSQRFNMQKVRARDNLRKKGFYYILITFNTF